MTISQTIPVTDTHAHICDSVFDTDRNDVLARAESVGVQSIIAVSEDISDAKLNIILSKKYHGLIKPAAGLYPSCVDISKAEEMISFIRNNKESLVAIGEVGLDYWIAKEEQDRELQRHIFSIFIDLSLELDLPLNVHSRSAGKHAVNILLEKGAKMVQLHAFDGKASNALPAVEAGFFFSVPPSIVRSKQKQKLVGHLPLSCLLLESDSPVLGPDPEKRNEPANAIIALEEISRLKKVRKEELREVVHENTIQLYGNIGQ